MCPNQIKRENSDNPFIREIIDILVLLLQVVRDNLQLPNMGQLCPQCGTLKNLYMIKYQKSHWYM